VVTCLAQSVDYEFPISRKDTKRNLALVLQQVTSVKYDLRTQLFDRHYYNTKANAITKTREDALSLNSQAMSSALYSNAFVKANKGKLKSAAS
jgi:hypothetical protein